MRIFVFHAYIIIFSNTKGQFASFLRKDHFRYTLLIARCIRIYDLLTLVILEVRYLSNPFLVVSILIFNFSFINQWLQFIIFSLNHLCHRLIKEVFGLVSSRLSLITSRPISTAPPAIVITNPPHSSPPLIQIR